jgi:hypothetical protein
MFRQTAAPGQALFLKPAIMLQPLAQVLTTFTQSVAAGDNEAALDLTNLPTGLYTLQLWKDKQLFLQKLVIAR